MSQVQSIQRKRRTALLMLLIFCFVTAAVAMMANWLLDTTKNRMQHEMEQEMSTQAANKVALLTVWSGTFRTQAASAVEQDMVRLFAAEAANLAIPAKELLAGASMSEEDIKASIEEAGRSGDGNAAQKAQFLARAPMMLRLLNTFIEKGKLWNACLLNMDFEAYLAPDIFPSFSDEEKESIRAAIEKRDSIILPVRAVDGRLIMDMVIPVLAPLYMEGGDKPVAMMVVSYDVIPVSSAISQTEESGVFSVAIVQEHGGKLELLNSATSPDVLPLAGWKAVDGKLPLALRDIPTSQGKVQKSYSLALPVPDMPWFVMQGFNSSGMGAPYAAFRRNVFIGFSLVTLMVAVLLLAMWWWLVARQERAVSGQIRQLYMVVNQQKQIMDGVNSASAAGIALNDLDGVLYYTNESYARFAGKTPSDLQGLPHTKLPLPLARSLAEHTQAVRAKAKKVDFTETLTIDDKKRHFLTSCSPFLDGAGKTMGVVSVYSDITEIVTAQERTQHMISQTVAGFVRAIEAVDPYLCGQSAFTATLASALATTLQKGDNATLSTLRTAASLAQIGMIQLPRELITKAGKLSDEERNLLHRHVDYARKTLDGIDFGLPVQEAICQMYERLDGSGYPEGLKGDAICFNARLLAVANTFCALMRPRSYRGSLDLEHAFSILAETPVKYDPLVVEALKSYLSSLPGKKFLGNLTAGQTDGQDGASKESDQAIIQA